MVKLSKSEIYIMHFIWNFEKMNSIDILKKVRKDRKVSEKSVRTLLRRLIKKNAITIVGKNTKTYYYKALIDKEEYIKFEADLFIENVYDGDVKLLLSDIIEDYKISNKEEIDEICSELNKFNLD